MRLWGSVIYIITVPKIFGHCSRSGEDTAPPQQGSRSQQIIHFHGNQQEFHVFFWNRAISSHNPEATWCLRLATPANNELLIQIIVAVPKLAKQDCGRATEEPCCARCTSMPWRQLHWSHWSWLWNKFVCNLTDFMNLLNSWEYAEPTSCRQSWCHHFSLKPQLIHHS